MTGNREFEIKQGLLQYVGAIAKDSGLKGEDAAQLAISMLAEVALESGKRDKGYDFYVTKPIIRAAAFLMDERARQILNTVGNDPQGKMLAKSFTDVAGQLKRFADSVQKD